MATPTKPTASLGPAARQRDSPRTRNVAGDSTVEGRSEDSFVVRNFCVFKHRNLGCIAEGHCKVLLAKTTDRQQKKLITKHSTSERTAAALMREVEILEYLRKRFGESTHRFTVELIDFVENYDEQMNHIMIMERGDVENGDLNKSLNDVALLGTLSIPRRIDIAINLRMFFSFSKEMVHVIFF